MCVCMTIDCHLGLCRWARHYILDLAPSYIHIYLAITFCRELSLGLLSKRIQLHFFSISLFALLVAILYHIIYTKTPSYLNLGFLLKVCRRIALFL